MKKIVRLSGMFILLFALMGLVVAPSATMAQNSNVEPNVGVPGTVFDFYAEGFDDEEYVGYWVNGPGIMYTDVGYAVDANDDGRADWSWKAPADAPTGDYTMVAQGGDTGYQVLIPFQLIPHSQGPGVAPEEGTSYRVDPEIGRPGDEFSFYAEGFEDEERVGYWLNGPQGIISSPGYWTDADNDGEIDWDWRAPSTAASGYYEMVARGETSRVEVVIPFQVLLPSEQTGVQPGEEAAAWVDPTVGSPGTEFIFYAEGFEDEERVGYWLNGPQGIISSPGYWTDADDDGEAEWEWRANSTMMPGYYEMVARGEESAVQHVIPFEIR
jgi:hypothetical protein